MYYEDLLETAVNDESSGDFRLRQKKTTDALKKADKHYQTYSIKFNNTWKGKFYENVIIENYGSGSQGTFIRNAVTGVRYDIIVGSSDEDLLFKVIDSVDRDKRRVPLMLYYDSPEQYENHHFTTVSPQVKEKWLERSLAAQKRLKCVKD